MKHSAPTIEPEHLLLALVYEGEGVAAIVLTAAGVSFEALDAIVGRITYDDPPAVKTNVPFAARSKKVMELSLREALQLGHNYIGTEHLLLGLIREGESKAAQILIKDFGIGLHDLRRMVIEKLAGYESRTDKPLDAQQHPAEAVKYIIEFDDISDAWECLGWLEGWANTHGPLHNTHPVLRLRRAIEQGGRRS